MLVTLSGHVAHRGKGYLILQLGNVGYQLLVPESATHTFQGEMTVYVHEVPRDGSIERFGFLSLEALELFWALIGISGVGPKMAQKIVFAHDIEIVQSRIRAGELAFLTSISGVGKKTAQKIILELKGVLTEGSSVDVDGDALEALVAMGYARREAQDVLADVQGETTEDRLRHALKMLIR